ncbi:phage tail assembly chaperone [Akkermansiaceae bacterium]|nr:phage tail assembly chaperone [Akkermansiaceae bacterium]
MTRYHNIANQRVAFTAEEETARDAEELAWTNDAPNRRMVELRRQRDALLAETDWMANSDVTMSDAWKTYRQALRDITSQTPTDDALSNITFPTKPS